MARRIGLKPLAQLCRRAGTSLAAGIDARRFWQGEAQRSTGHTHKVFANICQAVADGDSLTDALAAEGAYFPATMRELVTVGEETGRLAEVFLRLAEHYEHLLKLRRVFLAGMVWPCLQLTAAILVVGLLIYLIGFIGQLTGETIDILGLGLVGGKGVLIYFAFVGAVFATIAWFVLAWQRGWAAGRAMGWLAERVPALGRTLKTLGIARFTWSLAMTTSTGMEVRRAMALAVSSSQYGPLVAKRAAIDQRLASGSDIHEALTSAAGVLPAELLHTVAVGEEAGRLSESLEGLSREYTQKAETASSALTGLAAFLLMGLIGLLIIAVIVKVAMFYIGTIYDALDAIP